MKDAKKHTKLIDAKTITGEALLKLYLQLQAQPSTSGKRYMGCINMFHSTAHPSLVLWLQLSKFRVLFLLPLLHHISVAQRRGVSWKGLVAQNAAAFMSGPKEQFQGLLPQALYPLPSHTPQSSSGYLQNPLRSYESLGLTVIELDIIFPSPVY